MRAGIAAVDAAGGAAPSETFATLRNVASRGCHPRTATDKRAEVAALLMAEFAMRFRLLPPPRAPVPGKEIRGPTPAAKAEAVKKAMATAVERVYRPYTGELEQVALHLDRGAFARLVKGVGAIDVGESAMHAAERLVENGGDVAAAMAAPAKGGGNLTYTTHFILLAGGKIPEDIDANKLVFKGGEFIDGSTRKKPDLQTRGSVPVRAGVASGTLAKLLRDGVIGVDITFAANADASLLTTPAASNANAVTYRSILREAFTNTFKKVARAKRGQVAINLVGAVRGGDGGPPYATADNVNAAIDGRRGVFSPDAWSDLPEAAIHNLDPAVVTALAFGTDAGAWERAQDAARRVHRVFPAEHPGDILLLMLTQVAATARSVDAIAQWKGHANANNPKEEEYRLLAAHIQAWLAHTPGKMSTMPALQTVAHRMKAALEDAFTKAFPGGGGAKDAAAAERETDILSYVISRADDPDGLRIIAAGENPTRSTPSVLAAEGNGDVYVTWAANTAERFAADRG